MMPGCSRNCRRTSSMIAPADRKSTRLNSSHLVISYAVFCLKKKNNSHISIDVTFYYAVFGAAADDRLAANLRSLYFHASPPSVIILLKLTDTVRMNDTLVHQ